MIVSFFFFFNDTATTEIYTLSLHDALPISAENRRDVDPRRSPRLGPARQLARQDDLHRGGQAKVRRGAGRLDRKSTRLNSSHLVISYAVFCLKKKNSHRERCVSGRTHRYRG